MKKIVVIYSPICEMTGAFIGTIRAWLCGTDVEMEVYSFDHAPKEYIDLIPSIENCLINVFYKGKIIDSVPLHKEALFSALDIKSDNENAAADSEMPDDKFYTEAEIRKQLFDGNIEFIPIKENTYREELSMCLNHYPMGNPKKKYHEKCLALKEMVYKDIWGKENAAGIYAKMNRNVIGLLEVFPREVLKKYGYMTGTDNDDEKVLSIGCYEVAFGIPRVFMLDELMYHLLQIKDLFFRNYLEGIGILGWNEGFNPYWVYEKYGFKQISQKAENIFVMGKIL